MPQYLCAAVKQNVPQEDKKKQKTDLALMTIFPKTPDIYIYLFFLNQGPWRQPREDNTRCSGRGWHVCVAGPRLCDDPGLHH